MNYNELDIALKDFGRYVVEQSKANLQKDKKVVEIYTTL